MSRSFAGSHGGGSGARTSCPDVRSRSVRLVLELAILSGVVVCAATVTAVLTVRWWLARQNRVDRRRPSWAPSRWVWWPTRAARLHRRLRNAVSMVESCLPRSRRRRLAAAGSLAELVEGVSQQAVLVDDRLVVAARAPAPLRFV